MENHAKSEKSHHTEGSATTTQQKEGVKVMRSQVVVKTSHQIKNHSLVSLEMWKYLILLMPTLETMFSSIS
eukprot:12212079-Ditylum_brightwellii.AAC.1